MDLQGILAPIIVIGGCIFVHELGHFLVAKLLGVKVLRFSIGFGPRLLGITRGEPAPSWFTVPGDYTVRESGIKRDAPRP